MIRKTKKTITFIIIFFVFSIGVAALFLMLGDKGYGFLSRFTKEEMLDDYEYFWNELEENWPYFHTAKENNIDLSEIKAKYKEKISEKSLHINVFNVMSDMVDEISSYDVLGKVYVVNLYNKAIMSMESRYESNQAITEILNDKDTIQKYRYINKNLLFKVIGNYGISAILGADTQTSAKNDFDKNIQVEIIEKDKIARIKINSMFVSENNQVMASIYEENFKEIYKNLSNYEHIIFDVSDCVGTSSYLWENFIIAPNIEADKYYSIICVYNNTKNNEKFYSKEARPSSKLVGFKDLEYLNNFNSYFKHKMTVKSNLYENNISKAKKWIITSKNTKLEANNFVNYAKETKFATIIGTDIGKIDVPVGVGMIKLPKLGLVIAYDGLQYVDANGENKLGEITADIIVTENKNATDVCLDKISEYEKFYELYSFVKKVNEERKEKSQLEVSDFNVDNFTPDYLDEINVFSQEEIDKFLTKRDSKAVTKKEAIEDVEALFKLYKYTYAGYHYFGGDETHDEAKRNIINDIKEFNKDEISCEQFIKIISKNMNFVQDGHSHIISIKQGKYQLESMSSCEKYKMYINDEYDISYKNGEYFLYLNNKEFAIESVAEDTDLEKYIKTTIGDDGKLCYAFISLFTTEENSAKHSKIAVKDGAEKIIVDIKWRICKDVTADYEEPFEKTVISGIPVYTVHTMSAKDSHEIESLNEFSGSALKAKYEKLFIIDLRGNKGGDSSYSMDWFYYYTGSYPVIPIQMYTKVTPLYLSVLEKFGGVASESEKYSMVNGKWDTYISKDKRWVSNDNIIIVLIDYNVASAGEDMVKYLQYLDNVIFIGSNTRGAQLTGNVADKYLPNSGLLAYYGDKIFFYDTLENKDGKGDMPDIWVNPTEALDKAIKLCKYYMLNDIIK